MIVNRIVNLAEAQRNSVQGSGLLGKGFKRKVVIILVGPQGYMQFRKAPRRLSHLLVSGGRGKVQNSGSGLDSNSSPVTYLLCDPRHIPQPF